MATIGTIGVNVVARTEGITRGGAVARKEITKIGDTARRVSAPLSEMAKKMLAVGAAAATAALGIRQFAKAASEMDKIAKQSDIIGIDPQRLRELGFAAEQTGVSTDKLGTSLQRFGRRLSEAANGSGEALKVLQEMNLDAAQLEQMGLDKAFLRIADAVRELPNPLDRVRVAQQLFGREGIALVNTLNLGSEGLEDMAANFRRLAGTMDRADFGKVEQMNDTINEMQVAFKGLVQQILVDVAPAITEIAKALQEVVIWIRKTKDEFQDALKAIVGAPVAVKAIRDLREQNAIGAKAMQAFANASKGVAKQAKVTTGEVVKQAAAVKEQAESMIGASEAQQEMVERAGQIRSQAMGGTAALTRGSVEAFSATQEARRQGEADRRDAKRNEHLRRIEDHMRVLKDKEPIELTTVDIT